MLKLIKSNFKRTNDSIILAIPLILFWSIMSWYCFYTRSYADGIAQLILSFVTFMVMFAAFSAIWFYLVKKTLKLSTEEYVFEKDRKSEFLKLLKSVPKGLGKLFLPMIAVSFIYITAFMFIIFAAAYLSIKYVGPIDFEFIFGSDLFVSSGELLSRFSELPDNMLWSLNCFISIINISVAVLLFIGMLWIPEIVYSYQNPFKSLILSIKKLFSKFWKSLGLFVYISFLYLILLILNSLLMVNPYLYFIVLILTYYFFIYFVVLIFSYYEQEFQD